MKLAFVALVVACGGAPTPPSNAKPSPPPPPVDYAAMLARCRQDVDNIALYDETIPGTRVSDACVAYATAGLASAAALAATDAGAAQLCLEEFSGTINTRGLTCRVHATYLQDQLRDGDPSQESIEDECNDFIEMGCMYHDVVSCTIQRTQRDPSGRAWKLHTRGK